MRHFNRTHQGFTLIEIMVALALLSITMTSSYTLYQSLTEQTATQVKNIDVLRNLRSLQQKISDEVRKTGYVVSAETVIPDAAATSGVQTLLLEAPVGSYGVAATDSVNTAITLVTDGVYAMSVNENVSIITDLAVLFIGDEPLSFQVLPQNDHWTFGVSFDDLVSNANLDFENKLDLDSNNVYNIWIRATDGAGHSIDKELAITVVDVNPE